VNLKTDSFPVKKHWLSAGVKIIPANTKIFSKASLSDARKKFLAGDNQLTAIRAWMEGADLIKKKGRQYELTHVGRSIAVHDPEFNSAFSWWLVHLHLSASGAFPYSALFTSFDVDGSWMPATEVLDGLCSFSDAQGYELTAGTIDSYFTGVDASFRPGQMLYMLGLIERRKTRQNGATVWLLRRACVRPCRELIVYTALLLHRRNFHGQETVRTPDMLDCGFAKILGMRDSDLRDQLSEMRHDSACSSYIEYTRKQDLDSIHFRKQGNAPLGDLREYCYTAGAVKWK